MWMLGRPRRRLAKVRITGSVRAGQKWGEGRDQITVTSLDPDGDHALAYMPATARPGDRVTYDEVTLEIEHIIGDDPAPPGHNPSVMRRRDRAKTTT